MRQTYTFQNGVITVQIPESYKQEKLIQSTENFLKKVLKEKNQNGNCNTSGNF